ncbi:MAG: helix-turn-helix domain-containing protein [Gemmatimonadales bacterium]|jgi:excisionase family DNA binding protein|nr:helix-turn-helix domain-containing protein [Gemmatimonadales bacterium]MBT7694586.1 helix-turn-helix domain-containing protein [Gemmatimonadales bacterium]
MEPLLTSGEVAEILQIPRATLYHWRYDRTGPPVVKVGRHLRYRKSDLEMWIEERVKRPLR